VFIGAKSFRRGQTAIGLGPPCGKGHKGMRLVSSAQCVECGKHERASMSATERKKKRQQHQAHTRRASRALRAMKQLGIAF
jgi:hypothetical protein